MGKFKSLFSAPKQKTPQSVLDAERRANEAEAKAKAAEAQAAMDAEYKLKKQRGKASTILTGGTAAGGDTTGATRTLLGG